MSTICCRTIGRRVGESATDRASGCVPYTDCPADAFNMSLPANAFSDLDLPSLDMLEITTLNDPGEQTQTAAFRAI